MWRKRGGLKCFSGSRVWDSAPWSKTSSHSFLQHEMMLLYTETVESRLYTKLEKPDERIVIASWIKRFMKQLVALIQPLWICPLCGNKSCSYCSGLSALPLHQTFLCLFLTSVVVIKSRLSGLMTQIWFERWWVQHWQSFCWRSALWGVLIFSFLVVKLCPRGFITFPKMFWVFSACSTEN